MEKFVRGQIERIDNSLRRILDEAVLTDDFTGSELMESKTFQWFRERWIYEVCMFTRHNRLRVGLVAQWRDYSQPGSLVFEL